MNTMELKEALAESGDELSMQALLQIERNEISKHNMQLYIWGLEAKVKRLEWERWLRREI